MLEVSVLYYFSTSDWEFRQKKRNLLELCTKAGTEIMYEQDLTISQQHRPQNN